jgi:hypothetical protein
MTDYLIEDSVPLPSKKEGMGALLRKMKKGQSMAIPREKFTYAQTAAYNINSRGTKKFLTNKAELRVWCIED